MIIKILDYRDFVSWNAFIGQGQPSEQKKYYLKDRSLASQVIRKAREYSSNTVLFHQAVGDILGINPTDMKCLDMMMLNNSVSVTQLALFTGLSTGAATAMIDRLEKEGFIERHPHPVDRRVTLLTLSKKSKHKLQELFESTARAMEALMSKYSETELKLLDDFFGKTSVLWSDEREKLLARHKKFPQT